MDQHDVFSRPVRPRVSLSNRISIMCVSMCLLLGLGIAAFSFFTYRDSSIRYNGERVMDIAIAVASMIDPVRFAESATADSPDDYWYYIKERIDGMIVRMPNINFLYIIVPYNEHLFWTYAFAVPHGEAEVIPFGHVEEDPDIFGAEAITAMRENRSIATGIIDVGEWGHLISGFAPIARVEGSAIALVGADFDVSEMMAAINILGLTVLLVAASLIVIFGLVSYWYCRKKLKPLNLLTGAFESIATGNLTWQLPGDGGTDEIAQISRAYNQTAEKFRKMISSILKATNDLSAVGNELSSDMARTAAAVSEITTNIKGIKDRVHTQSASVNETHKTMEQVVENLNELGRQIENQSGHVSAASESVEGMVATTRSITETLVKNTANVNTLTETSEAGRASLSNVAADIQEIARESEGLMEINSVMENIASQTNLLSMNAAIEAAHAGETGKGFAVVADEIRKLAKSSSDQSKIIGEVLKKIKISFDKIASSTENVLNKFEAIDSSINIVADQGENIRNSMEEQGMGSKQILDGMGNVNEITQSVKNNSHEMLSEAKEVIKESQKLGKATLEIERGINEIASRTEQINATVHHVKDISVKNRERVDMLIKEVSRFKVS